VNPAFFQSQLDFIYFLYGLAFILVASVCLILNRRARQVLPWHWLGLFGVLHGCHEWMELLAVSLGDNVWTRSARLGLMVASFLCLTEFGRSGMKTFRGRSPGLWIYVPLGVLAAGGGLWGLEGMASTSRYVFGVTGGMGSAWMLWQVSRRQAVGRRSLALTGAGMAAYALATGVVASKVPFFPAAWINQETFLRFTGLPIQLVRGMIAYEMAAAIWVYSQTLRRAALAEEATAVTPPRHGLWFLPIFTAVLLVGWGITESLSRLERGDFSEALSIWSQTTARSIDPAYFRSLNGTPASEESDDYRRLKAALSWAGQTDWDVRRIALLGYRQGQFIFLLDAHPENSKGPSVEPERPGTPYRANFAALAEIWSGADSVVRPLPEPTGTCFGAYAAIRDPAIRTLLGVLVVETDTAAWKKYIVRNRLGGIIITLLLSLLVLSIFTIYFRNLESAQHIAASEEHYRSLFANLLSGGAYCRVVFDSAHRPCDLLCVEVNEMFEQHTGLEKSAVVGRKFSEVFPGAPIASAWIGSLGRGPLEGKSVRFESYFESLGRWFSVSAFFPRRGECAIVFEDITSRKQAEEALKKAHDAALESARFKSEFMAKMSHEIRTPLNAIIGMHNLLLETELSEKQKEFSRVAVHAGEALLTLINDILDFSKIESGKMTLENIPFEMDALVREVMELVSVRARSKGLTMVYETDPALPRVLRGDPARLRQVLVNLVGNAVKFSEHGEIRIEVRGRGTDWGPGLEVYVSVKDNGIGIPADIQGRLFEAFRQADNSTTRKYGGTGLGLAISRQLVELMGGTIGVKSAPGQGSTFWFTFPSSAGKDVKPAPQDVAPKVPAKNSPPSPSRILVAEDNQFNRFYILHQLQNLGYQPDVAADGRQALELLSKKDYDLVFMDCLMPEMDGYDATAAIRKREDGSRHTPIVALTANAVEGDREKCLAAGMDDFLLKPVDLGRLQAILGRWLPSGSSSAGPDIEPSPVDEDRLRLVSDGDLSGLRRLMSIYLKSTAEDIARLGQAVREGSAAEVHRIAHGCAGASESFGMSGIVPPLRRLIAMAKEGQLTDSAAPLVEEAQAQFDRIKSYLEARLKEN